MGQRPPPRCHRELSADTTCLGDDDGGLIGDKDRTVVGYMKYLVKSPLAHDPEPEDPAVNKYSECYLRRTSSARVGWGAAFSR